MEAVKDIFIFLLNAYAGYFNIFFDFFKIFLSGDYASFATGFLGNLIIFSFISRGINNNTFFDMFFNFTLWIYTLIATAVWVFATDNWVIANIDNVKGGFWITIFFIFGIMSRRADIQDIETGTRRANED